MITGFVVDGVTIAVRLIFPEKLLILLRMIVKLALLPS